jgi:hypothetical protein
MRLIGALPVSRRRHAAPGGVEGGGFGPRYSGFGGLPGSDSVVGTRRWKRLISSDERDSDQVTTPVADVIAQNAKKAIE